MAIFRKAKDGLANGTILGALLGAAIVYSDNIKEQVISFVTQVVPANALTLGTVDLIPIYLIGFFALIGYIIDRV